jgi:hypothetical protein
LPQARDIVALVIDAWIRLRAGREEKVRKNYGQEERRK